MQTRNCDIVMKGGITSGVVYNDWKLREVFRETIANWLQLNYSKIENAKARKAHPEIMSWFRAETKASARRDPVLIDLEAQLRELTKPVNLTALLGP